MKNRTKDLSISKSVKEAVAARDSVDGWPCCILCGLPAPTYNPLAFSNAHYISRGQGGLGIEENILTLCWNCHQRFDGAERNDLRSILRRYLIEQYPDWDESKLTYMKGADT